MAALDILLVAMGIFALRNAFVIFRTGEYKTKTAQGETVVTGRAARNYAIIYTVAGVGAIALGAYGLATAAGAPA